MKGCHPFTISGLEGSMYQASGRWQLASGYELVIRLLPT
jgi:hypothetical protein